MQRESEAESEANANVNKSSASKCHKGNCIPNTYPFMSSIYILWCVISRTSAPASVLFVS